MILSHPLKGTIKRASNFLLVNVSFCAIKGNFPYWSVNSEQGIREYTFVQEISPISSSLLLTKDSPPTRFEPATYLLAVGWRANYIAMACPQ
jgi:hypothetical protein